MPGFGRFRGARRALAGVEAMAMSAEGEVGAAPADDAPARRVFVRQVFGLAA
jgi:phosphoheptose isomerase